MKLDEHSQVTAYMSTVNDMSSSTAATICGINFLLIMDSCFPNDL